MQRSRTLFLPTTRAKRYGFPMPGSETDAGTLSPPTEAAISSGRRFSPQCRSHGKVGVWWAYCDLPLTDQTE